MNTRIHEVRLKSDAIKRTPEFERKGLAMWAVNPGLKCSHGCTYCSTGASVRTHKAFKKLHESPFRHGYAIIDRDTPRRVAEEAASKRKRGLVQLCTTVDAWAPEAHEHRLGRQCLEALMAEPGWEVRILTKNASVTEDFDFILKHRDRIRVGLSITGSQQKSTVIAAIEPNASPIEARMDAMRRARHLGLRTYGMLCPLLPGIADDSASVQSLVDFALDCGAEEIFMEPVNPRGNGLILTQEALEDAGFLPEARAVEAIRTEKNWSPYVVQLLRNTQRALANRHALDKLRFLLYPQNLTATDQTAIETSPAGVKWLD
jgi:DNA repair photolyase